MTPEDVIGYAASKAGELLEPFNYASPVLSPYDVRIDITHCGVCYTDIQGIENHYGISTFPFVPGHEIVGMISAVGDQVNELKIGDRVGVGWQGRSCMQCEWCIQGQEQQCLDIDNCGTWKPYGGFADSVVVDSRFAYRLPDEMLSEHACVLMCAGVSVYAPLQRFAPQGGKKVGVIGIGGLGHLALQFAHAMNCHVTAISSTPRKKKEALEFGANVFIDATDEVRLQEIRFSLDLLLYTSHTRVEWTTLLNCLRGNGRLVVIGFSDAPIQFDPLELVVNQMSITGSLVGSRNEMREMLSFAQDHGISPKIELMPLGQVNDALARVKSNQARYRIVLVRDA